MFRLWLVIAVGAGFLVTSGVIASMARAQPTIDPSSVITGYETARNRHDLDAAVSYFADNAVITQRNSSYTGKDEIRKYLDTVTTRTRFVVISDRHTSGNLITWTERATLQAPEPGGRPANGTIGQTPTGGPGFYGRGTGGAGQGQAQAQAQAQPTVAQAGFAVNVEAVVQDGKIQSMAYVFGTPNAGGAATDGRAQIPATLGLAAVLSVLIGALLIASLGLGRATPGVSSLRGRLMHDLQGWAAARQ